MMEEELNYVTATFTRNGASAHEEEKYSTVIYDQVAVGHENTITPENPVEKKAGAGPPPLLCVLAAALGITCAVLMSVIIALSSHFSTVKSEREGEMENLTAQILLLRTDVIHLERKTEELTREKDQLNWTIGVILQYDVFPVDVRCPQKACQPCPHGWRRFKSNCYLFEEPSYSYQWKNWEGSRDKCKEKQSDLVVIDSLEEQEFINNNTKEYDDDAHGYWIGLSNKNTNSAWMWINGSNMTVEYWKTQKPGYKISCALTLPKENPLASWNKVSCVMKNRWICKTKVLIKFD